MYIYALDCCNMVLCMGHGRHHVFGSGHYQSGKTVSYSVIVSCQHLSSVNIIIPK